MPMFHVSAVFSHGMQRLLLNKLATFLDEEDAATVQVVAEARGVAST